MILKQFDRSKLIAIASVVVAVAMTATAAMHGSSSEDKSKEQQMQTQTKTQQQHMQTQQGQQQQQQRYTQQAGQYTPELYDATKIVGKEVTNTQGETLGTVEDLILDSAQGKVSFAVIAPETEGIDLSVLTGQTLHAIPWDALQIQQGQEDEAQISLNIDQNRLTESPSFESDNYPQVNDPYWQNAHQFFSQQISQSARQTGTMGQSWQSQSPSQQSQQQDRMTRSTQQTADQARQYGQSAQQQTRQTAQDTQRDMERSAERVESQTTGRSAQQTAQQRQRQDQMTQQRQGQQQMGQQQMAQRGQQQAGFQMYQMQRLENIIGLNVRNRSDEDLGQIENLKIDANEGRIAYAVISYGGVLGIGEQMAAVPFNALELRQGQDFARLNADRQVLDQIAYTSDDQPDFASAAYGQRVHEMFDTDPYWVIFGYVQPTQQQFSTESWQQSSQYNQNFRADSIRTVEGEVLSVGTFRPDTNAEPGLRLRVRTDDNRTVTVHAGPKQWAQEKGFNVSSGDKITVKGSETEVQGCSVIMATELESQQQKLQVRNEQGQPQWQLQR